MSNLLAQQEAGRQPLFKRNVSQAIIFNITIFSTGKFISKAMMAKCQALTGAECHEHYQGTHLDAIF